MLKKTIFLKNRISVRSKENKRLHRIIILAGLVSLLFYLGSTVFIKDTFFVQYSQVKLKAAEIMQKAVSVIREHCFKSGVKIDEMTDPNNTGLIGSEFSEITTTLGHLQAKRTTTNPNFAALIVHFLNNADVSAGDTVAIGCSASFPALMIASLAAARAMEIHPVIIISLGASSYGANNMNFNLLNIYQLLLKEKVFDVQPAAISLGGEKDIGEGFKSSIKQQLIQQIQESKYPFIYEPDLQKNVLARKKIYMGNSSESRISAFINIGGSYANFGINEGVLKTKPGLNTNIPVPSKKERGVIFEMAGLRVPVIHLLYIKGLVLKYGLPWDPIPLPEPGQSELFNRHPNNDFIFCGICFIYFVVLFILIIIGRKGCSFMILLI